MKRTLKKFRCSCTNPAAIISIATSLLAIIFRFTGYLEHIQNPLFALSQILLPVICSAVLIFVMIRFGKEALWLSVIPVFIGILSFVIKLFIDPRNVSFLHHFAAILLYISIVALWGLTVFGVIYTKWPLVIVFILPFIVHLFVYDMRVITGISQPLSLSGWLKEFSMLSSMLSLSCCALSFEKE